MLRDRHGVRTSVESFRAGDFAFGCGHTRKNPFCEGDRGCRIGIERKTISDLVGSLIKNRLSKQIPDMLDDYHFSYVVVEGLWRPTADDQIEIYRHGQWRPAPWRITYSALASWLVRYDICGRGRLHRWRTSSPIETAAFVTSVFRWFQKDWHKHQLQTVDKMPPPVKAIMRRWLQIEKTAASLPEVGVVNCKKVGRHFRSIYEMMNASVDDWRAAGLGKKDAMTVYTAIRREYR